MKMSRGQQLIELAKHKFYTKEYNDSSSDSNIDVFNIKDRKCVPSDLSVI